MKTKQSQKIIEIMQKKIDSGEWKAGEQIPSEPVLANTFCVSRSTIREALQEMSYRGHIYRVHGVGSFVTRRTINYGIDELASISEIITSSGYKLRIENVLLDITKPTQRQSDLLHIASLEPVYHIQRIYYADDKPVVFDNAIYPCGVLKDMEDGGFKGSTFHFLEQCGHTVKYSDGWVRSVSACGEPAKALQVASNTPLLLVETVIAGEDGNALGYIQDYYTELFNFPIHRVHSMVKR